MKTDYRLSILELVLLGYEQNKVPFSTYIGSLEARRSHFMIGASLCLRSILERVALQRISLLLSGLTTHHSIGGRPKIG
jgi:hypothetical protein